MGPSVKCFLHPMALTCTLWVQIPKEGTTCAMGPCSYNGPGGIRTLDLFSAIEARSQLRYRPVLHPDFKFQNSNGLRQECQAKR